MGDNDSKLKGKEPITEYEESPVDGTLKEEDINDLIDGLCILIRNMRVTEEDAVPIVRTLIETYPDLVNGTVCENNLSGMYAYVLNFYRVDVFLADGSICPDTFKVVKLGMSTESLTNRVVGQGRVYVLRNAWIQPRIPGFDLKDRVHTLSMMKQTYVTSDSFAEFVREEHETFPDMVFVAPGLVADETHLRERYGIRIGKWELDKDCLDRFFDGEFQHSSVVTSDNIIKAGGGWKIWLTYRGPGYPGVDNYSPGPSEYFLMRVQDIEDCKRRFLKGEKLVDTRKDPTSDYTSMYKVPHKCIIHRSDSDEKPLILLKPS